MHFLYILYSKSINKYYVGETVDVENRLQAHNQHKYRKGYTKAAEDWKIALKLELESKENALYIERFIKKMKSKKFIEKAIQNPLILQDILKNK